MRLSFRTGDILIWMRFNNIFSEDSLSIRDVWQLKAGDFATLTNRWDDIPSWFELFPTEATNTFSSKMLKKIEEGYKPKQKMEGPNIWKVNSGDTIVWIGKSRPDMKEEDGALSIIRFNEDAIVLGESISFSSIGDALGFGGISEYSEEEVKKVRHIFEKVREEGIPRIYSTEWGLG